MNSMAPEYPTPTMLALDTLEARSVELVVSMGDKRDAAKIFKRMASEKDAEADRARARLNRLNIVRARILRSGL